MEYCFLNKSQSVIFSKELIESRSKGKHQENVAEKSFSKKSGERMEYW